MMYYQIAQLSYSSFLFLTQMLFLCMIKRRSQNQNQVFSEQQQINHFLPVHNKQKRSRRSSLIMRSDMGKSVQLKNNSINIENTEDPPTLTIGINSNQNINSIMKEQKFQTIQLIKNESLNNSIQQIQSPNCNAQNENLDSQRQSIQELIVSQNHSVQQLDIMINLTYYIERIGFEQGLILLFWNFDVNYYIFIPISLFAGVLMRLQENLGYRLIQMIILLLIHGFLILETYLIISDGYETFCYLIVLGIETIFSLISYILKKKCN